ncbi:MAG TPA: hypothetical protein PL009_15160 [Flavipsychrobacter sp.]|nr:hypothetical protein [Flavipsychrobacter sp.]
MCCNSGLVHYLGTTVTIGTMGVGSYKIFQSLQGLPFSETGSIHSLCLRVDYSGRKRKATPNVLEAAFVWNKY